MSESKKDTLKKVEDALKAKIAAAKKIEDVGERLLRYKALQESCEGLYQRNLLNIDYLGRTQQRQDVVGGFGLGALVGSTGGLMTAVAIGVPASLAMIAAFPVAIGVGGAVAVAGGAKVVHTAFASQEKKHAAKMYKMEKEINSAIKKLTGRDHVEELAASLRFDDVVKKFPNVAAAFTKNAEKIAREKELMAKREEFLAGDAPSAKKPGPKF